MFRIPESWKENWQIKLLSMCLALIIWYFIMSGK